MYYLYLFACYFTHLWRYLMPGYRHEYFAIKLLFPNSWKCYFITLQARVLSSDFNSVDFRFDKNVFSMGPSQISKYQSGVNGNRAKYRSVYSSIYDYYDYIKRHNSLDKALSDVPQTRFNKESQDAEIYRDYCLSKLQSLGYFSQPVSFYSDAMAVYARTYSNYIWLFITNWLLSCLPAVVLLVSPFKRKKANGNRKKWFR